jgi:hypothetical protein
MSTADTVVSLGDAQHTDERTTELLGQIHPQDLEAAANWLRQCAKHEWWRLPDSLRDDVGLAILILEAVNNATRTRCLDAKILNARGGK